jgi:hypothetical protein
MSLGASGRERGREGGREGGAEGGGVAVTSLSMRLRRAQASSLFEARVMAVV